MKWILVTTNPAPFIPGTNHPHGAGWNIGDVFARIGTEQVIREVDPAATFDLINMDDPTTWAQRDFDRAVFAGRPMFWKGCETHPLWHDFLFGWLCQEKRKVMALGVGDCFALPEPFDELHRLIREAEERLFALTVRRRIISGGLRLAAHRETGVCPASWVLLDRPEKPTRSFINFMPGGAHYPAMNLAAAKVWDEGAKTFSYYFQSFGSEFIAHTLQEAAYARDLGWHPDRIVLCSTASQYLAAYATASFYAGNRIHGAIVLASRYANATAIGLDSRIYAAEAAGMMAVNLGDGKPFTLQNQTPEIINARIAMIRKERAKAVELLRAFAN